MRGGDALPHHLILKSRDFNKSDIRKPVGCHKLALISIVIKKIEASMPMIPFVFKHR